MRTFKRLLTVFATCTIAFCLAFGLSACGGAKNNDEELIRATITELMDTFKDPTPETVGEYIAAQDTSTFEEYGIDVYEFFGACFKRLEYSIDSVEIDGDTATVTMTVTNVNLGEVMTAATEDFSANSDEYMADIDMTADDALQQLMQKVFGKFYEMIDTTDAFTTTEVTLNLAKVNGEWQIDDASTNALVSAMYGGLQL